MALRSPWTGVQNLTVITLDERFVVLEAVWLNPDVERWEFSGKVRYLVEVGKRVEVRRGEKVTCFTDTRPL